MSIDLSLYSASENDKKALCQIYQYIAVGEFWSLDEVLASLIRDDYKLWYMPGSDVETHKGIVWCGFIMVQQLGSEAEIMYIFVDPEQRGLNLGSHLLSGCVEVLKKQGVSCLRLEVKEKNLAAQKLYKKHGFITTGRRTAYYRDGSTAILMERTI